MDKREFHTTEKKILRLLYQTGIALTYYEIAKEIGVSFPTAKKYTDRLFKDKIIKKIIIEGEDVKFDKEEA